MAQLARHSRNPPDMEAEPVLGMMLEQHLHNQKTIHAYHKKSACDYGALAEVHVETAAGLASLYDQLLDLCQYLHVETVVLLV